MASFKKTLISLLLVLVLTNVVASQTTFFTYNSFSPNSKDLIYQGDASVPPSYSWVRLTKVNASGDPEGLSVGRVVYSRPVRLWDTGLQAAFQTTIKFNITSVDNDPADGLAFFVIPVGFGIPNSSTGGNFGLYEPTTGTTHGTLAVEFDIYRNPWDPRYPHIGINLSSRFSAAVSRFEDSIGEIVTARINYFPNTGTLSVVANYASKTATLTHRLNLRTLPREVQVGISAATGDSVALHHLHAWDFTSFLVPDSA